MAMQLTLVESSNIEAVGYDKKKLTLTVKFWRGGIYNYTPFTESAYQDFLRSESLGSWFYKNVKSNNLITATKVEGL